MSEKNAFKPGQLWNQALKAVKGENTAQLVEEFTSEMTLVAEGLCEDQARIRRDAEDLRREMDRRTQALGSDQDALETMLREQQRDVDRRLDDLTRRLNALESASTRKKGKGDKASLMQNLILLAGIVCGSWVLVTVLNLFQ